MTHSIIEVVIAISTVLFILSVYALGYIYWNVDDFKFDASPAGSIILVGGFVGFVLSVVTFSISIGMIIGARLP